MTQPKQNEFALVSQHEEEPAPAEPQRMATYCELFRFASRTDHILMLVGSICACISGGITPFFMVLWGQMADLFNRSNIQAEANRLMLEICLLGVIGMISGLVMYACWMVTGERQVITCRKEYLKSLLKQDIGWFDKVNQSSLSSRFTTDCYTYQGAIGQKLAAIMVTISMFISGIIVALLRGWVMTVGLLVILPTIALGGYMMMSSIQYKDSVLSEQYSKAAGKVQEAINAIKTVKQLNGEQYETQKYAQILENSTDKTFKLGAYEGLGLGMIYFFMICAYSYGFWFGSQCRQGAKICQSPFGGPHRVYSPADVITIFYSVFSAGMNLIQLGPSINAITSGRIAAARIFASLDRKPTITSPDNGIIPKSCTGIIRFQNVSFAYPKDPSRLVLKNLNLQIKNKSTAFVGDSGCGKSTIFQLLMRFYDPDEGSITLDGIDLRELDLKWLRRQFGYVGQEPVLFATTIRQNLLFGKQDATDEQIIKALQAAQALSFVNKLQDKLETYVGMGGGQLSGGQKQRIGIARALLKNPRILLLDEATSALDRENQRLIQATLDHLQQDRISITIAHRVHTIEKCDQIFVFQNGKVVEQGKFKQLQRFRNIASQQKQTQIRPKNNKLEVESLATLHGNKAQEQIQDEEAEDSQQQEQLIEKYGLSIYPRLVSYVSGNSLIFIVGLIANVAEGIIYPVFSIFFGKMLTQLIEFDYDPITARRQINFSATILFCLALLQLILPVIYKGSFTYVGYCVSTKIRTQTYSKILNMPVAWFDEPKNSSGALSTQLEVDCTTVNNLITTFISVLLQDIGVLIVGLTIAFLHEPKTAVLALVFLPLLIFTGIVQIYVQQGLFTKSSSLYKSSAQLISEVVNNIRTVSSFECEQLIEQSFQSKLVEPLNYAMKKGAIAGLLFGISEVFKYMSLGLTYYIGVMVHQKHNIKLENIMITIYSIAYSALTIGNTSYFIPEFARSKIAATSIFNIQDSKDEDQIQAESGSKMLTTPIKGNISIKDISFTYKSRTQKVLDQLNLEVKAGTKVGFVGPSGCGKSTLLQLLLRFYDYDSGTITVDGIDLKDYDIHHLRSSFGVVSQQPVLFNDSIGENIRYNRLGATQREIVEAADEANFNPDKEQFGGEKTPNQGKQSAYQSGFDKNVGVKGSHISGGQKQRVAIARVLLRKPRLLLLDEATSALDAENQKIVQKSLDTMMQGKTSLVVAHRVSTIRESDLIVVFEKGKIAEKGSYSELMAQKGYLSRVERGLFGIQP